MPLNTIVPMESSSSSSFDLSPRPLKARALGKITALWNYINISRYGAYSAARVEALEKYCQNSSLLRVVFVAALVPFPALILELLIECIPLEDPSRGLKSNYGFCIRFYLTVLFATMGCMFQLRVAARIPSWKMIVVIFGAACGTTALMILISSIWVFPIPFSVVILAFPGAILIVILFLAVGATNATLALNQSLKQKLLLIVFQAWIIVAYITFSLAFSKCSAVERFGLLLFLPIMKTFLKHQVAKLASSFPESIPATVVLTVDLFNGLYSAICIQSSGSWLTSVVMITLNIIYMILSTLEINRAADLLCKLNSNEQRTYASESVARAVASVHDLPMFSSRVLQVTNTPSQSTGNAAVTSCRTTVSTVLLFYLEYRALVGYTETVIPLLYAMHLSILVNLPNSQYYPHICAITPEQLQNAIGSIVTYAWTEMASLMWLNVLVKRKLGFSLLHQLAFVLETEMEQLQGNLFVWIIVILQITLVHFGMDLTFRFEWMK